MFQTICDSASSLRSGFLFDLSHLLLVLIEELVLVMEECMQSRNAT